MNKTNEDYNSDIYSELQSSIAEETEQFGNANPNEIHRIRTQMKKQHNAIKLDLKGFLNQVEKVEYIEKLSPIEEMVQSRIDYPIETFTLDKNLEPGQYNQFELLKTAKEVTLGDLHANTVKAIEHLVVSGLVSLEVAEMDELYTLFDNPDNHSDTIAVGRMIGLINMMEWIGGDRKFRLMGDVFCDRNGNDYLNIALINHLRAIGADIDLFAGNHEDAYDLVNGIELAIAMPRLGGQCKSYFNAVLSTQKISIIKEMKANLANKDNYAQKIAYNKRYSGAIKEIYQSIKVADFDRSTGTLYCHAPLMKRNLSLATNFLIQNNYLQSDFKINNTNLDVFCNSINSLYQDYKTNPQIFDQVTLESIKNQLLHNAGSERDRAKEGLLWVGGHDYTADEAYFLSIGVENIVHGHDRATQKSPLAAQNKTSLDGLTVFNLDNDNGKKRDKKYNSSVFLKM